MTTYRPYGLYSTDYRYNFYCPNISRLPCFCTHFCFKTITLFRLKRIARSVPPSVFVIIDNFTAKDRFLWYLCNFKISTLYYLNIKLQKRYSVSACTPTLYNLVF